MPSHNPASALLGMYHDANGAPWNYPTWKEITGVTNGLFPDDPSQLPKGWTRKDADDVRSYFSQFASKLGEEDRITFATGRKNASNVPGRQFWRTWVVNLWATCHISDLITQVLSAKGIHPIQIMVAENNLSSWPPGPSFLPLAIDDVCLKLFGPEALNSAGMASFGLRPLLQAVMQYTWATIYKTFNRDKARFSKLTEKVDIAYQALDREQPSRMKIRNVINSVAKWKRLALLLGTADNLKRVEEMEEELQGLMSLLGAKVNHSGRKTGISKATEKLLQTLASEENVQDLIAFYRDCFCDDDSTQEFEELSLRSSIDIGFASTAHGKEAGVEIEANTPLKSMEHNLGLIAGLPLLFNKFRLKTGLAVWSKDQSTHQVQEAAQLTDEFEQLKLHPHQIAGIHACMRLLFSIDPSSCTGVLLADDVGLGKTFQALAVVALLATASFSQIHGHSQAPLIAAQRFLGSSATVPNLSHLIVVPGTLMSQWENEAKTVFRYGAVDILLYRAGKARSSFWGPEGLYAKSKHSACHIIIIASSSAIQNDFNDYFLYSRLQKSSGTPWNTPPTKPGISQSDMESNIFGHEYLTVIRDEAQDCRNPGPKHVAMLALLRLGRARLILTATPLQTSTKDIAAMGRLVGIPHFLSENAMAEEKEDEAHLRRAKRETLEEQCDSEPEEAFKTAQVQIAARMQSQFHGRVIRRTVESQMEAGNQLLSLPPCVPVVLVINLTSREMEAITLLSQKVAESVASNNAVKKLGTKGFYLEYRMAVGFVLCNGEIPRFECLSDWNPVKSTKIDVCSQICKHLLAQDDAPMVYAENGEVVFPPIPCTEHPTQHRKILIYQEFTSLSGLLQKILSLYGIASAAINGDTTFEERAKTVSEFTKGEGPRVLVISAVGGVGLNLSCANVVIFLDQPWSSQDVRQIRGRVHRQPQQSTVHSIHLLASETADILLAEMAEGKKDMLEAFLSKDNKLRPLLTGKSLCNKEDESPEDIAPAIPAKIKKRKRGTASKTNASRKKSKTSSPSPARDLEDNKARYPSLQRDETSAEETECHGNIEQIAGNPQSGVREPSVPIDIDNAASPKNEKSTAAVTHYAPGHEGEISINSPAPSALEDIQESQEEDSAEAAPLDEQEVHNYDNLFTPSRSASPHGATMDEPRSAPPGSLSSAIYHMEEQDNMNPISDDLPRQITTQSALAEIRQRKQNVPPASTVNTKPPQHSIHSGSTSNTKIPLTDHSARKLEKQPIRSNIPPHRRPIDHELAAPPASRKTNANPMKRRF